MDFSTRSYSIDWGPDVNDTESSPLGELPTGSGHSLAVVSDADIKVDTLDVDNILKECADSDIGELSQGSVADIDIEMQRLLKEDEREGEDSDSQAATTSVQVEQDSVDKAGGTKSQKKSDSLYILYGPNYEKILKERGKNIPTQNEEEDTRPAIRVQAELSYNQTADRNAKYIDTLEDSKSGEVESLISGSQESHDSSEAVGLTLAEELQELDINRHIPGSTGQKVTAENFFDMMSTSSECSFDESTTTLPSTVEIITVQSQVVTATENIAPNFEEETHVSNHLHNSEPELDVVVSQTSELAGVEDQVTPQTNCAESQTVQPTLPKLDVIANEGATLYGVTPINEGVTSTHGSTSNIDSTVDSAEHQQESPSVSQTLPADTNFETATAQVDNVGRKVSPVGSIVQQKVVETKSSHSPNLPPHQSTMLHQAIDQCTVVDKSSVITLERTNPKQAELSSDRIEQPSVVANTDSKESSTQQLTSNANTAAPTILGPLSTHTIITSDPTKPTTLDKQTDRSATLPKRKSPRKLPDIRAIAEAAAISNAAGKQRSPGRPKSAPPQQMRHRISFRKKTPPPSPSEGTPSYTSSEEEDMAYNSEDSMDELRKKIAVLEWKQSELVQLFRRERTSLWKVVRKQTEVIQRMNTARFRDLKRAKLHQRVVRKKLVRVEGGVVMLGRECAGIRSRLVTVTGESVKTEGRAQVKKEGVIGQTKPKLVKQNALITEHKATKLKQFFGDSPPLLELFLQRLGYEQYTPQFVEHEIGLVELPHITEDQLVAIGIPLGPRQRIINEAQLL